jgi:hypothetical protein
MKTDVYSWRVARDLKTDLEREARRRKTSISALLGLAAREWLNKSGADSGGDEEQRRLHRAASKCLGVLAGGDAHRSETVRQSIRQRLNKRYGR